MKRSLEARLSRVLEGMATSVMTETDLVETCIAAQSQKQAMDWSLALMSQGIESTIIRDRDHGWLLCLPPGRLEEAQGVLAIYQRENRRWHWRRPFRTRPGVFHWGAVGWCMLVIFLEAWSRAGGAEVREAGLMNSAGVEAGEWWRLFTATTMHADLAHLMSNVCFGLILVGLAMARWGAGAALLAVWCAGAIGNVAGFWIYGLDHRGLGASGMVMGALGLLAASPWHRRAGDPFPTRDVVRGIAGGILLFVLLGLNPSSDTVAHLGGFIGGVFFGMVLAQLPDGLRDSARFSLVCGVAGALWLVWVWTLALHG